MILPDNEENPETYNISFTVNNGNNAIEGATVTIGDKTGTTGSAGGCTISNVVAGTVSVTISADGYTSKTESLTVDSSHTSFTISLESV